MLTRWSPRFLIAVFLLLTVQAFAAQKFTAIYIFGDSYADVGNIYIATHGSIPPSPPYYQGRFSNGPLWVDHLGGVLSLPVKPSLIGGTDYAVGGAEVLQPVSTPQGTIPSIPEQVAAYLKSTGGQADPNALYVIEGGGDDILHASGANPGQLGYAIAQGLAGTELALRQAGARHFLIPNLLDVGQLPAAAMQKDFASAATKTVNGELYKALLPEHEIQGVHIYRPDVYSLFQDIARDPTHLGFTNIASPCLNATTGAVCNDPSHTLFWDAEHVSEFAHSILAALAEEATGN